ncbi:TolC family protein [Candidatus Sumerlaeota bacterium]|nr:TolC family protein [Candidatus Sumerlaeota bacterium]
MAIKKLIPLCLIMRLCIVALMMWISVFVFAGSIQPATSAGVSDDDFTSPLATHPLKISLDEVIAFTLQNNLDIKTVDIDRLIAEYDIGSAYGIFDPTISVSYERSESEEKNISGYAGLFGSPPVMHETEKLFVASISQLLPTGALLQLSYNMFRYQTNDVFAYIYNPYYRSEATLTGKQPLLKNAGIFVTTANIRIAKVNRKIINEQFQKLVIDILSQAIKTYWDLVFAIENYEVHKISLQQAEELLRSNRVKYETGVLPATDVLQAEAQVAARKDELLVAAKTIRDVSDALKKIMNISRTSEQWQATLVPLDKLSYQEEVVDEEHAYCEALLFRPDYSAIKKQKELAEIQRRLAKNQLLPELNVFGTYGFSGIDYDINHSHDELESLDYNHWSAGIELAFPLLNLKARNEYKKAKKKVSQLETQMRNLEQNIRLEVRNAVRKVQTNLKRIGITEIGVEFEKAKLQDELRRFEVGMATSQDVLDFQRDLAVARARHLSAITEYLKSLVELKSVTGTLLRDLNIVLQPASATASPHTQERKMEK